MFDPGILGGMFDFNKDGKLDMFESAAECQFLLARWRAFDGRVAFLPQGYGVAAEVCRRQGHREYPADKRHTVERGVVQLFQG